LQQQLQLHGVRFMTDSYRQAMVYKSSLQTRVAAAVATAAVVVFVLMQQQAHTAAVLMRTHRVQILL
jgi:hypothetical protein